MSQEEFEHWLETNLEDAIDSLSSESRYTDKWIRDLTAKLRALVVDDDDDDLDVDDADDVDPDLDEDEEEAEF